jgi:hypothetical protein
MHAVIEMSDNASDYRNSSSGRLIVIACWMHLRSGAAGVGSGGRGARSQDSGAKETNVQPALTSEREKRKG